MSFKSTVLFIDFDDSFSANIIEELKKRSESLKVVNWRVLKGLSFLSDVNFANVSLVVLGPGPGHVDDYKQISQTILQMIRDSSVFFWGICLGHQLLWSLLGGEIQKSLNIKHGQNVEISIPPWSAIFPVSAFNTVTKVQRYNSWVISPRNLFDAEFIYEKDTLEALGFRYRNALGFQFHPESVGTYCPDLFFDWVEKYLYTKKDEHSRLSNRRNLRLPLISESEKSRNKTLLI
jgi:anthranilate/para-aminobenzoate synthase component II